MAATVFESVMWLTERTKGSRWSRTVGVYLTARHSSCFDIYKPRILEPFRWKRHLPRAVSIGCTCPLIFRQPVTLILNSICYSRPGRGDRHPPVFRERSLPQFKSGGGRLRHADHSPAPRREPLRPRCPHLTLRSARTPSGQNTQTQAKLGTLVLKREGRGPLWFHPQ